MDFKDAKIELAPQGQIREVGEELVYQFLEKIFGVDEALVTDESTIYHFMVSDEPADQVFAEVQGAYGVDVSGVPGGNLAAVVRKVKEEGRLREDRPWD